MSVEKVADQFECARGVGKARGQGEKAVQRVRHPEKLCRNAGLMQAMGVGFPLVAQGIVFRRDDERARLAGEIRRVQRGDAMSRVSAI